MFEYARKTDTKNLNQDSLITIKIWTQYNSATQLLEILQILASASCFEWKNNEI